jgi:hypothetical protein
MHEEARHLLSLSEPLGSFGGAVIFHVWAPTARRCASTRTRSWSSALRCPWRKPPTTSSSGLPDKVKIIWRVADHASDGLEA